MSWNATVEDGDERSRVANRVAGLARVEGKQPRMIGFFAAARVHHALGYLISHVVCSI